MKRIISLVCLSAVLYASFREETHQVQSAVDIRAALLVFIAPLFVLTLFQKSSTSWVGLISKIRTMINQDASGIAGQLTEASSAAVGQYGYSAILKLTEEHADPMVRYGGELVSGKFSSEEIGRFMGQKIQAEDQQWQGAVASFAFLAKMAPYFGMLATVIGMVQMLQNMSDFTKISGSIGLAMQGTLYGLISFVLIYAPLQKLLSGWREQALLRNEMIARWLILVTQKADPLFIAEELKSMSPAGMQAPAAKVKVSSTEAKSSV